ncbi:MAG: hypothetical protein V2I34_04210 [Bacteroidales bacterium]|jgi:hypothetical protein|nr:hypothetical protein [Bacteroidales bacterium]
MNRTTLLMLIFALTIKSCLPPCENQPVGFLPSTPVNMAELNSEYDDYNTSAIVHGSFMPLCFSTKRNSGGDDFDIIYEPMIIKAEETTGEITVLNDYSEWPEYQQEFGVLRNALDKINTDGNELGPYYMLNPTPNQYFYKFLFMYASNETGNYQIGFTYNTTDYYFYDGQEIGFLSSPYDDLYPCFNIDFSLMYFCSDRDNDVFNIYSVQLEKYIDQVIDEFINTESLVINMEETLSGAYNDMCPYLYGNMMVFASDRPGGEGGYDLYYSLYQNEQWSEAVNFGSRINSPYDEYRPIIINEGIDMNWDMLIFSSDRPGGKGGFDLYFVGIDAQTGML